MVVVEVAMEAAAAMVVAARLAVAAMVLQQQLEDMQQHVRLPMYRLGLAAPQRPMM